MQAAKESSVLALLNALRAGASPAEAAEAAGLHPLVAERVAASPLIKAFLALDTAAEGPAIAGPEAGLRATVGVPI